MAVIEKLWRESEGSVALLFGLAVMVLGLAVGLAIDTARVFGITRQVQFALDAAAIEAAKLLNENAQQSSLLQARAQAVFNSNVASIGIGTASISGFAAIADTSASSVNVTVDVQVPATFARLAGIESFHATKTARSSYNMAKLEVVLALDVTGSMNGTPSGDTRTKLAAMKMAARGLVNQLFDEASSDTSVRISVVPWSSSVNAGSYYSTATGNASGSGCVVERAGTGATSDSLPGPGSYAQPASEVGAACPDRPVTPLKSRDRRNEIIDEIDVLAGAGATAGHIGAAWAWYMVSPTWSTLHPTQSRPRPFARDVVKAVIIMTDGVFNVSYAGGGGSGSSASYSQFQAICAGMRTQGIKVHTVAFDLGDATALSELASCATSGSALTASNSVELAGVFSQMASELTSLRITR